MVHFKMFEEFVDREDGVTLLSVMIGLVIFSLFFLPFLEMEKVKDIRERRDAEEARIELIEDALLKYAARVGGYPAPADPSIPVIGAADSINHGVSIRVNPATPVGTLNAAILSGVDCNAATPPVEIDGGVAGRIGGVLCRDARPGVAADVYIGALPISELGLNLDNGLDSYGNKYTYIVSRLLVQLSFEEDPARRISGMGVPVGAAAGAPATVNNNNSGAIRIFNENGRAGGVGAIHALTAGNGSGAAPGELHFAVIGHGENGFGSFTSNGVQIPCGTAGDTAGPLEIEHCTNMPNGQDGQVNAFEDIDRDGNGQPDNRGIDDGISLSLTNSFDDVVRGHYSIFQNDWARVDNDVLVMNAGNDQSAMKIGQTLRNINYIHPTPLTEAGVKGYGLVDVGDGGNSLSDVVETARLCHESDTSTGAITYNSRFCFNTLVLTSPDVSAALKCNSTRGMTRIGSLGTQNSWTAYRTTGGSIQANCDIDTKILAGQLDNDCSATGSKGFDSNGKLICR